MYVQILCQVDDCTGLVSPDVGNLRNGDFALAVLYGHACAAVGKSVCAGGYANSAATKGTMYENFEPMLPMTNLSAISTSHSASACRLLIFSTFML